MARVNIMTAITDNRTPAKMPRIGMWLIEVIEDSFPVTHQGTLERESITAQELTLQLLANALTKLKKLNIEMDEIEIYLDCTVVRSAFMNHWLDKWSINEWKSAKGEEIADKSTWMLLWNLLTETGKRYIAVDKQSRYENWMHTELNRAVTKKREKEIAEESIKKIMQKLA